ncbi:hypothetical protein BH23ACT12_BH23ACT12_10810 [soil metagenome]
MNKKSKPAAPAPTTRRTKLRRGFLRRRLGRLVVMSAVGAAIKYFSDAANRKKITGLVGK